MPYAELLNFSKQRKSFEIDFVITGYRYAYELKCSRHLTSVAFDLIPHFLTKTIEP